ncbi:MAG: putative bifunctional diguanylate cyclase/phosphodiesterase, partial [Geminicoccaceae bacterium]
MNWENRLHSLVICLTSMRRDALLLVLWALSSTIVVLISIALTWQTSNHLLRQELRSVALDWATFLENNVDDLEQIMATGNISNDSLEVLRSASSLGHVFHYQLFDVKGVSVYASDGQRQPDLSVATRSIEKGVPTLYDILASDHPIVSLEEHDGNARLFSSMPEVYGQIYMPIMAGRSLLGMAEIHVDQTEKAAYFHQEFGTFATGLALLILFAMALPMVMVWRKTKQRELAERQLHDMAHTDPLTRLANRTNFRDRLVSALGQVERSQGMIALFWLDLDRFKTINDALGHPIGDSLLCQVAERLRRTISHHDTVARLGGDELAIVLSGCRERKHAADLAERLIKTLAIPFDVEGHHVVIGVSIGIVFAPSDGDQVDSLLKKADIALYRAKDAGRSTYRFFKPDMEARSEVRHVLEEDLRTAIQSNQLRLHYQPQVCLDSGRINGFEALLRWHHPRFGHMPPGEVVALAEETGLIMPLGYWALQQACADANTWPESIRVSVNISAVQFSHTNLVDLVSDALNLSGLAADRLDLEITESIVMADTKATVAKLRKLRRLGVHLSMDDFGTGYSSLSRLRHLPFNHLKVDRSFVKELGGNPNDTAIVHAIVALGHNLGMQIIAEGIETDAQLAQLRTEGCDIAQGFFFGRPVPATEIGRQLARHNPMNGIGLH